MHRLPSVRYLLWLAILLAGSSQIGAMAQSDASLSASSPAPAPGEPIIRRQAIAQLRDGPANLSFASQTPIFARQPPKVRSFALLPHVDERTAELRVEFSDDVRLPKEIELQLDKTRILLRPNDKNVATTRIEFDIDA